MNVLSEPARVALQASDIIALRCFKLGIPYPDTWNQRDEVLRAIARGEAANFPWQEPAKPWDE